MEPGLAPVLPATVPGDEPKAALPPPEPGRR